MKKTVKIRTMEKSELLKEIQYPVITVNTVLLLSSWTMIDWIALSSIPFLLFLWFFFPHISLQETFFTVTMPQDSTLKSHSLQTFRWYKTILEVSKRLEQVNYYLVFTANTEKFTSDQLWIWLCQAFHFLAKTNWRYDGTMLLDINFNLDGRSKF